MQQKWTRMLSHIQFQVDSLSSDDPSLRVKELILLGNTIRNLLDDVNIEAFRVMSSNARKEE